MNDREYVKLNTSIQTGSNASNLIEDADGNVEALIELRLPQNFFGTSDGPKRVDSVTMQTSKMRLSLEKTPIAQIPLDVDFFSQDEKQLVSSCQLDVYPFAVGDGGKLLPTTTDVTAFPHYKDHKVTLEIWIYQNGEIPSQFDSFTFVPNGGPYYGFPQSSPYYSFFTQQLGLNRALLNHPMNLWYENLFRLAERQPTSFLVKTVGAVEQILQDALENAITYASTSDEHVVRCYFVTEAAYFEAPQIFQEPKLDPSLPKLILPEFDDGKEGLYFWYWDEDQEQKTLVNHLDTAVKPRVRLDEESMTIEYDSAPFTDTVPVILSPGYIDTYDHPEQMSLDVIRKNVWVQPPPKRVYKYDVTNVDDPKSYNFSFLEAISCAGMSIIGNREMKETFSFLPWKKVNADEVSQLTKPSYRFNVQYKKRVTTTTTDTITSSFYASSEQPGPKSGQKGLKKAKAIEKMRAENDENDEVSGLTKTTRYEEIPAFEALPVEEDPEQRVAIHYTYWYRPSVGNAPENRINQVVYFGYEWGAEYEGEFPPLPNRQNTSAHEETTIQYEYNTVDDSLVAGETVNYDYTGRDTVQSDLYPDPIYPHTNSAAFYYEEDPVNPGTRVWTIGAPLGLYGEWRPGYRPQLGFEYLPPRELDSFTEHIAAGSGDEYIVVDGYWLIPANVTPYVRIYHDIAGIYSQKETETAVNTVLSKTITALEPDPTVSPEASVLFVPNLVLTPEDKDFYMLDGNAVDVSLGVQEPVQHVHYRYKVRDVETVLKGEEKTTKTVYFSGQSYDLSEIPKPLPRLKIGLDGLPPGPLMPVQDAVIMYYQYELLQSVDLITDFDTAFYPDHPHNRVDQTIICGDWHTIQPKIGEEPYMQESEENRVYNTTGETNETVTYEDSGTPVYTERTETTHSVHSDEPHQLDLSDNSGPQYPLWGGMRFYVMDRLGHNREWVNGERHVLGEWQYHNSDGIYYTPPMDRSFNQTTWIYRLAPGQKFRKRITTYWYLVDPSVNDNYNATALYGHHYEITTTDVAKTTKYVHSVELSPVVDEGEYKGNVRMNFTWGNLPMVVLSPISSIVLLFDGIQISPEIQPINIAQLGQSSLTTTVPVVENFYSMASTLRDLHDELVVGRDNFETAANYSLSSRAGLERTIRISAHFISKDGTMHKIYIPKNGVFSVQLIFGLSLYYS